MEAHIGTSGFSYKDWVGRFYPPKLPPENWLTYYATKFDSVELNVTFYRTPREEAFAKWYRQTPADFGFVSKGSRFITHIKRLREVKDPVRRFFDAALPLKEKLKVVLWQLPPQFSADLARLSGFLKLLPTSVRHAFEFRERSWLTEETYRLLRDHRAALVFSDHPFGITEPSTADFLYVRRHGPGGKYHVSYPKRDLAQDAALIRRYGKLTYEFFNNDVRAVGARNALELKAMLSQ